MAKKPAIAKAYKRRPAGSSAKATATSGASAGKSKGKPLSRKDREYMAEFGVMDINDMVDGDEDAASAAIAARVSAKRAFTEEDLDAAERKRARVAADLRRRDAELANGADADDVISDDEDGKPSSFELLVGNAQRKKKSLLAAFKKSAPAKPDPAAAEPPLSLSSDDDGEGDEVVSDGDEDEEAELLDLETEEADLAQQGDYPNHYDLHFAENPERQARAKALADGLAAGTHAWQTLPLDDDTTFQLVLPRGGSITAAERDRHVAELTQTRDLGVMHVKSRVLTPFLASNPTQSPLFMDLFGKMDRYSDMLFTAPNFNDQAGRIRRAYVMHALNHVFKYRDRIIRGNVKVRSAQVAADGGKLPEVDLENPEAMATLEAMERAKLDKLKPKAGSRNAAAEMAAAADVDVDVRDQGFTRPKVLFLCPMRNVAYDVVSALMDLSGTEQQENKKRFKEEYYQADDAADTSFASRPADYRTAFRGNTDDCFKLGIKFSRKAMKLYSQFYQSDMVVASPLGLRMMIEGEKDADFLSSIELVVIDSAHILNMQNWDHLTYVLDHMNRIPRASHDCDFSRIKGWYLDGLAPNYRQLLAFAEYTFPELSSLFNSYSRNVTAARVRYRAPVKAGSIVKVKSPAPQTFVKLDAPLDAIDDARFKHLTSQILPKYRRPRKTPLGGSDIDSKHLILFVPSYFDFVRIRNHMDEAEYDFEVVSEYTEPRDKTRARTLFFQGRTRILVYTERAHFFHRQALRGALHVVMYGLPDNAQFYPELVDLLTLPRSDALRAATAAAPTGAADGDVTVLYSKWDALKLERVVGPARVAKLIQGVGPFVFRS
ncbi:rRNA-binding ribosome biosynthesis protein utp25 [Blastocladiella emersonii ATCC 22665]|nr:rRNA-binding ribosome biosynthesis protein utp25 [Blastocladiella emersonii ATCC 22665]